FWCPGCGLDELVEIACLRAGAGVERLFDDLGDGEKRQAAFQEAGDGDLVRRIEHAGRGASQRPGAAREAKKRKRVGVDRLELERQSRVEVEVRELGGGPLWIGERKGDRYAHVRIAAMRKCGPVAKADESVYDRCRLDHDLDPVVGQPEEEVRLDHL